MSRVVEGSAAESFRSRGSIWFDREAASWNEALPVGNGFMGAMVFGGVARDRLQLNEDSVWSGGPMDRANPDARAHLDEVRQELFAGHVSEAERMVARSFFSTVPHMRHYQTLGDVWIDLPALAGTQRVEKNEFGIPCVLDEPLAVEGYERHLALSEAVVESSFTARGTRYIRECFASHPAGAIVYRVASSDGTAFDAEVSATRKDNHACRCLSYCDGIEAIDDGTIRLHGWNGAADGIGYELIVRVMAKGGSRRPAGSHIVVEGASEIVVVLTARTTFRSQDPLAWCLEHVEEACRKGFETLRAEHLADYGSLYNAFSLRFDVPEEQRRMLDALPTPERLERARREGADAGLVETFTAYARYLLISSSRVGSLPANLQGIWNEDFEPAWGSKYTININIQMIYWIAEQTGLSSLHLPLFEHLMRMLPHGREVARSMYGARGFCCHHNTDIWGDCAPQDAHTSASVWPMGGAWLCLHVLEHYLYTGDKAFLEGYYPLLEECVEFFLDYLVEDGCGHLVTGPSCSPENTYIAPGGSFGSACMGPTMDIEILRDLFEGFLGASKDLDKKGGIVDAARAMLDRLPGLGLTRDGRLKEWTVDYDELEPGHRHVSHLFALFPSQQIRVDKTPELAEGAQKTLKRRLEHGGGHTGWSKAWMISLFARLADARSAWRNLEELLQNSTQDNLLDSHPPFELDGNMGAARAVLEMCVQDYGDKVVLLPALPMELGYGHLQGMRLKTGGALDMDWAEGMVTKAVYRADRAGAVCFEWHGVEGARSVRANLAVGERLDILAAK